jgi:hypothetical protein
MTSQESKIGFKRVTTAAELCRGGNLQPAQPLKFKVIQVQA